MKINRDDMLELTRRMTSSRSHIMRLAGAYIDEEGYVAMPITVFDIKKHRTKDEMIRSFTGVELPVDFNKRSLNHGYLLAELSKDIPYLKFHLNHMEN